ncbi:UbiH/UbiF/VisC/COQ6 family ubiquinone biosynthesis hydroxylase [Aurantivibrio plasticivorans]
MTKTESHSEAEFGKHYDVIIAGAGLVGTALACGLAIAHAKSQSESAKPLNIIVVDPGKAPALFSGEQFDPRVVALTRQSQDLLDELGVWQSIVDQRACAYQHMSVWDGEGTGSIQFDSDELHEPNLGHIVENSVALNALLTRCIQLPNVELLRGQSVVNIRLPSDGQDEPVTIQLNDGQGLTADLVVAADGALSPLRQQAGLATREWDYGHRAIVTTVRCEKSHQFTAWQRFSHTGPLAFLPLQTTEGNAHYCSIVWSCTEDLAAELLALEDAAFASRLERVFEQRLGRIEHCDQRFSFPLRQRHAVDYIAPRFALVGDAAHTIHPLAGQGVNLGFHDVKALIAEVTRAGERGIPLGDPSVLKRFQRQCRTHNLAMMATMEGFKRLFGSRHPALQVVRNSGLKQVNQLGFLKKMIARQAMGIGA